jgi:hypothetical protein
MLFATRQALKDLAELTVPDSKRIQERLKAYATTPDAAGQDVSPLKGVAGDFRL